MKINSRASWLLLFALASVFAARPCSAQPDCAAFAKDPLPQLAPSAENSKRLTDCAYALTHDGDYRRAQALFERALEMSSVRADRASRALALAGLGLTLGTLGQPDRAEKALTESLQISEALHDSDGMAEASSQLGHLRSQAGHYEEARTFHLRSFALWESLADHNGMAVSLNNVGATYRAVGDNSTALDYFQRSLAELERLGDRRRSATVIDNIGRIYRTLGDYATGMELAQKALAIRETLADREGMSRSLNSLSECYQAEGNYAAALDALRRSLDLRTAIGYALAVAEGQNNIAVIYEAQGNYAQAIVYLRKSLALNAASVHSDSLAAEVHTHLGEIYARQGRYAQAVLSLQQALAGSAKAGLTLQAADARLALARVYLVLGRPARARQELQRVLEFRAATGDRRGRAEALIAEAEATRRLGRPADGLAAAAEARDMADAMEIPEVRWLAATEVGQMHVALHQPEEARAAFDAAIEIVEQMRVLNAGSEESDSRFFADRQAPYQGRIAVALATSNTADAFYFAERSKARVLLDAIRGDRIPISKALTAPERSQETELRTRLTSVNSELAFAAGAVSRDEGRITALRRKRDERRLAYEGFQAQLYAAHPELRVSRADVPAIRASDARQLLAGPSEAILEFVTGPERTHVFLVTSTRVRAFSLPATTTAIVRAVEQFRDRLAHRDLRVSESSRQLYDMVLGPIGDALTGKSSLIVVPDGMLWNLPFQALQSADGRYLIERAAISYAPSVTVLREMMRPRAENRAGSALLAFGNPAPPASAPGGEVAAPGSGRPELLRETEREVTALAPIYGPSSRIYIGAEAQEDRWKAEASSARVVHLATHGVLDNASPLYSHLVLARPDRSGSGDGLLEAWEIMDTPLRADLVVLSACETARGRVAAGEGVIGLMWAVFVAGAPSTLVTQWRVDSASSTALMVAFHREWRDGTRQVSKARALQAASLAVLHMRGFAHPYYWAGFILSGDER